MVNLKGIEAYNNVASLQGTTMKIDTTLNYTTYELKVKELLKEIHVHLLENDYVAAASTIEQAIVELRLMRAAVKSHIKE
jgi:dihydroneopterin aldolase